MKTKSLQILSTDRIFLMLYWVCLLALDYSFAEDITMMLQLKIVNFFVGFCRPAGMKFTELIFSF